MRPEVIVVGLGSMGAAAAYQLARRGVRVLGVDRFAPPHPQGAHTGGSRIIRMAYAEGASYVPLLRRAYELWREVERAAEIDLLRPSGGLMLGRPESSTVSGALATALAHGLDHELLDAAQIRRRFPVFAPADEEVGVYEEVAGILRPEAAVTALLDLAAGAGAELRYGVRVTGWRAGAGRVTVETPDGEVTAERLVLCPGAGAGDLLADLPVPFRVERRVQHYWATPGEEFAPDRCPVWIWASGPDVAAYGMPATDPPRDWADGTPVVKAAFHTGDGQPHPADDLGEVRPSEVRSMLEWITPRLPTLPGSHRLGGRPCRYTLTPDEHFVLGPYPGRQNVTVAAGFSGHGFKFVPVIGEILADLAQHGVTGHQIELFAPDRFSRPAPATRPSPRPEPGTARPGAR